LQTQAVGRLLEVEGTVVEGYGAASGRSRFQDIGGTIRAQKPYFEALGMPIKACHNGTINVDVSPMQFVPVRSKITLVNVKWHKDLDAENFSFFDVLLTFNGKQWDSLVYLPHPETKRGFAEAFPPPTTMEILAARIEGLFCGAKVVISAPSGGVSFCPYHEGEKRRSYSATGNLTFVDMTEK
jgi:hypothetical protein